MNAIHWKHLKKMSSLKNEAGCVIVFHPIIILGILLIFFAAASVYLGRLRPNSISFPQKKAHEVTSVSKNLPVSREPWKTLSMSGIVSLRNMLIEERFGELNAALDEYQKIFERDPDDEYKIFSAYSIFSVTNPSYESFFEKWIAAYPDRCQPYLAAAEYYHAKAWESRGGKLAKETSKEEFQKMSFFLEKAKINALTALKINSKSVVAYSVLLEKAKMNEGEEEKLKIIRKIMELFPYSFMIKAECLLSETPKWGGSYAAMEQIARDSERYAHKNARLSALYGYIYLDQADLLARDKKYEAAVKLIDKAISFGDVAYFYKERARLKSYYMQQHEQAMKDINRSIEMIDTDEELYRIRSGIYFYQSNYDDSLLDIAIAEKLSPEDKKTKEFRDWTSGTLLKRGYEASKNDFPQALDYYNISLKFNANNFETYYFRAVAFNKLNDNESAFSDLENAIKINPRHFESYRMMDYLLAKNQEWKKIISYWDKFIALEPNHAEAYFERSGSHYHNRDMEKAMNDLKKACDFGSKNACKQMNKML